MKKWCFILCCFILSLFVQGQNLVPNGDFYLIKKLPTASNYSIDTVFHYWFSPNGISPLPITSLATDVSFTARPQHPPLNYPQPVVGESYVVFGTWFQTTVNINRRTYLSTRLNETTQQGKWYRVRMNFFNAQGPNSHQFTNNFGFALTDSISENHEAYLNITPEINIDTPVITSNKWFEIDTCFIASKSKRFLTIGNFFNDSNTIINPNSSLPARLGVDDIFLEHLQLALTSGDTVFGCSRSPLVLEATKDCWYKWARKADPQNILH
ncbi:MAG: hypothetical protein JJU02_11830, partial [Cryomorphaceae bacterium]|nr:hypothetical protein [Cryomorphaceae bacterium]